MPQSANEAPRRYYAKLMRFLGEASHTQATAFVFEGKPQSYGELHAEAKNWASSMYRLGLRRGDRVAVMLEGRRELLVALIGNYLLGTIHVPINTRYRDAEIEHILEDAQPSLVVVEAGGQGCVQLSAWAASESKTCVAIGEEYWPLEKQEGTTEDTGPWLCGPSDDEQTALLIYTSGTTGRSKGVELSFRAVVANIDALTSAWRFDAKDHLVLALPLFHVHGLCIGIHGTLLHGMSAIVQSRFEPAKVADAIANGATVFMGVPTMYARLLAWLEESPTRAETFRQARLFTSGSAALPVAHFHSFEALTGHRILERYGMSETLLTLSNPYEGERRPGSVGMAVGDSEVRILDESGQDSKTGEIGEIAVRGLSLMTGYRNLPEQTEAAFREGWFLSGDVARIDSDGYVHIVGRRSIDIIKSGGYKISAREIEEVLREHPEVSDVAVVGLEDETWGQRIVAAVVVGAAAEEATQDLWRRLEQHCRAQLADYKTPREFRRLEALPTNAMGKIQKHRLVSDWPSFRT